MKVYRFRVKGIGPFPTDMLRYDRCWPDSTEDAIEIDCTLDNREHESHSVTLEGLQKPTNARWLSFGWSITQEGI